MRAWHRASAPRAGGRSSVGAIGWIPTGLAGLVLAAGSAWGGTAVADPPAAPARLAARIGPDLEIRSTSTVIVRPRTAPDFARARIQRTTGGGDTAPNVGGMAAHSWAYRAPVPFLDAPASERRARLRIAPTAVAYEPRLDAYVVPVPAGFTAASFAASLEATGDYRWAVPNTEQTTTAAPDDPGYGASWHHQRVGSERAWDTTTGSPDRVIAIVDTGVDLDHPDLLVIGGYNAVSGLTDLLGGEIGDVFGHGTKVAGSAAAIGNNGTAVTGMGWNFPIQSVRVTNGSSAPLYRIVEGILWAADNGASAITSAWTGVTAATANDAGAYALERNALLVWGSGNANSQIGFTEQHDMLVVAGSNSDDTRYGASNFGLMVDVAAPANGIRTTVDGGNYYGVVGTSYGAGVTTGLAALIFSANPSLAAIDVHDIIRETTDDIGPEGEDDEFGTGRIRSDRAIDAALDFEPRTAAPFVDGFDEPELDPARWSPQTTAATTDGAVVLGPNDILYSRPIRTRRFDVEPLFLDLHVRPSGAAAGDALLVQVAGDDGVFATVATLPATGTDPINARPIELELPMQLLSNRTRVRVTVDAPSGAGLWRVEHLSLAPFTTPVFPISDRFETGAVSPRRWAETIGAQVSGDEGDASDGHYALVLDPNGSATTLEHAIAHLADRPRLVAAASVRSDTGSGTLVLEATNAGGQWIELGSIDATPEYTRISAAVPSDCFHNRFKVRLRSQSGGRWIIDDVFIGDPNASGDVCPGDWDLSGTVDIFDLIGFLEDFFEAQPAVDIDQDGDVDTFDLLEFLRRFSAGCDT